MLSVGSSEILEFVTPRFRTVPLLRFLMKAAPRLAVEVRRMLSTVLPRPSRVPAKATLMAGRSMVVLKLSGLAIAQKVPPVAVTVERSATLLMRV